MNTPYRRTPVAIAIAAALALAGGNAYGSAFGLAEQAGSGQGNAFAGGAAAAEDASTVWFNPAGMSRLARPEVAASFHVITPSIKFRNETRSPRRTSRSDTKAATPARRTSCPISR